MEVDPIPDIEDRKNGQITNEMVMGMEMEMEMEMEMGMEGRHQVPHSVLKLGGSCHNYSGLPMGDGDGHGVAIVRRSCIKTGMNGNRMLHFSLYLHSLLTLLIVAAHTIPTLCSNLMVLQVLICGG